MRKTGKKLLICLLAAVLLLVQVGPAYATSDGGIDWNTLLWNSNNQKEDYATDRASKIQNAANTLYNLGLIQGSGTNADGTPDLNLGATFTRGEGAAILTNLMGGNQAALSEEYPNPYTDDLGWAKPFILYATANDLVSGTGSGEFNSTAAMDIRQFLVMVLRMTGYWERANCTWEQSPAYAITCGVDVPKDWQSVSYTRGDAILACYSALDLLVGEEDNLTTFRYTLEKKGVIPSDRILDTGFTWGPIYPTVREVTVTDPSQMEKAVNLMIRSHVQPFEFHAVGVSMDSVWTALTQPVYSYRGVGRNIASSHPNEALVDVTYIAHEQVIAYLEGRTNRMEKGAWEFLKAALALHPTLVDPSMSDYEQVKIFHDYIVNNTHYDPNAPGYGTLATGTGMCEDYTMTFELLCWLSGIDCRYVTGDAYGVGGWQGHAWNKVLVDGTWYNIDLTFDDPITNIGDVCLYDYFLKSDATFRYEHHWEECSFWPACNTDMNVSE